MRLVPIPTEAPRSLSAGLGFASGVLGALRVITQDRSREVTATMMMSRQIEEFRLPR
jgi:hypothetical protein